MKKPFRMNEEEKAIIKTYVEKNPTGTFTSFKDAVGGKVICSDTHFYQMRRKILGNTSAASPKVPRTPLYMTVWSYPTEQFTSETKKVLNDFIQSLNGMRRARFQMIELKDPAIVEIRETSK